MRSESSRGVRDCSAQIACHCVGTKKQAVMRSPASRSSVAPGWKSPDGTMTLVPPRTRYGRIPLSPAMWKSGSPDSQTWSSPDPIRSAMSRLNVFTTRLRWLSTAALGRPVVPDVYMMKAGSFSSTAASTGPAGPVASGPVVVGVRRGRRPAEREHRTAEAGARRADGLQHGRQVGVDHGRGCTAVGEDVRHLLRHEA